MEEINSSLRFVDYFVDYVDFKLNNEFEEKPVNLKFDIDRSVDYLEDENNTMLVTLIVKVFDNALKKNYPFSMNVSITGVFELNNVAVERKEVFAEVNAVAILFPYIRALITNFTANVNVAPLILPAINVVKLMEDKSKSH